MYDSLVHKLVLETNTGLLNPRTVLSEAPEMHYCVQSILK